MLTHAAEAPGSRRPVLYLDIDDTLLSWASGDPEAASGARSFLLWAMERFTLRWLSTWCPTGEMEAALLDDLCRMVGLDAARLREVRGLDWEATGSKLNGIAWVEHLVLRRPFVWIEDEYGVQDSELRILAAQGMLSSYRWCNVTEDPDSLARLHAMLEAEWLAGRWSAGERVAAL